MNPLIMIPARMAATRLPNKPLALIGDTPMIVRAYRQAEASGADACYLFHDRRSSLLVLNS